MKKIILITDLPIDNQIGGLERAANTFRKWFIEESYFVLNINKNNFKKEFKNLFLGDLILFIGHRSYFIIFIALIVSLLNKKVAWCAFWHDYKLEKKKNFIFYKLYDYFFKKFYQKSNINLVVSDYEAKSISTKYRSKKIYLPTSINCEEKKLSSIRNIDVFIPGRDVPHKRFQIIRDICNAIGLKYLESNANFLTEKELINAYLSSKYIFIPSLYESYSLVALEGMCCGCNLIVSDNVMIKDSLNKYNNFVILNRDEWEVEKIKKILNKLPHNYENVKNALKVQSEFSDAMCKKQFLSQLNL